MDINTGRCSLVFDGNVFHIIKEEYPTIEQIENCVGEKKPAEMNILTWLNEIECTIIHNVEYETVIKLDGWCVDIA